MAISTKLTRYLIEHDINFKIVPRFFFENSFNTVISSHTPLPHIAKAVLLFDEQGRKLMAVLPASHKINFEALNTALCGTYQLMPEIEVVSMFADCEKGAVPPIAEAYHLNLVYEQSLDDLENIYLEAGDHKTLLEFDHDSFEQVVESGKRIHFSYEYYH